MNLGLKMYVFGILEYICFLEDTCILQLNQMLISILKLILILIFVFVLFYVDPILK
jgi:hypothetical protein